MTLSFSGISLAIRAKCKELEECNAQQVGWLGIIAILTFYCLFIVAFPFEPADDLLRNMKAYAYGYDYRLMWPFSPGVPHFDPYLLFDMAVGTAHRLIGQNCYYLVQIAAFLLNTVAVYLLCKDAKSTNWRLALTLGIVIFLFGRIYQGRPSIFESGLFLLALAICQREKVSWWWHLALALLMASFYYLFFIYLIPLVVYRRAYLVGIIAGFIGWFCYAGAEYFQLLKDCLLMSMPATRGQLVVMELSPLTSGFFPCLWALLLIPVVCFWRKDFKRVLSVLWFALPNQIRYMETLIPLMGSFTQYIPIRLTQIGLASFSFIVLIISHRGTPADDSWRSLSGIVPAGSSVLCLENEAMFKLVYANDNIKVTPSTSIYWETQEYQASLSEAFHHGTLSPLILKSHRYDYVVEKSLKHIPAGLTLCGISGKYRVWKVPGNF